jgi:hypothetical protein
MDRDNLTLRHLLELIPDNASTLQSEMSSCITKTESGVGKLRQHRNRRIGHFDLKTRTKKELLPSVGLADVDGVLSQMADVLNAIVGHYDNNECPYEYGICGGGGATSLIEYMDRNEQLERYFEEKEFGPESHENGGKTQG